MTGNTLTEHRGQNEARALEVTGLFLEVQNRGSRFKKGSG